MKSQMIHRCVILYGYSKNIYPYPILRVLTSCHSFLTDNCGCPKEFQQCSETYMMTKNSFAKWAKMIMNLKFIIYIFRFKKCVILQYMNAIQFIFNSIREFHISIFDNIFLKSVRVLIQGFLSSFCYLKTTNICECITYYIIYKLRII